jgi:aminoglycoside phosphotransferase (APT) family kinase protein
MDGGSDLYETGAYMVHVPYRRLQNNMTALRALDAAINLSDGCAVGAAMSSREVRWAGARQARQARRQHGGQRGGMIGRLVHHTAGVSHSLASCKDGRRRVSRAHKDKAA